MSQNLSLNLSHPASSPTCKMPTAACSKVALKRSSLLLSSSSVRFCSVMSYWTPSQYRGSPPPSLTSSASSRTHTTLPPREIRRYSILNGSPVSSVLTSSASTRSLSSGCSILSQWSSSTTSALAG